MTVPTSDNREEYTGNDSTTVFPYAFKIFEDSDLEVYLQNPDGTETPLVLDTDYTVSGAGDVTGGNVTYPISGDPLASDEKLVILRVIPVVQETDIRNQGAYYPQTVEDEFDRSRMIDQQQQEQIGRTLKRPPAEDFYDANGFQIKNLGDGTDPQDAVTKSQQDERFNTDVITQTSGRWDGKGKRAVNFQTSDTPKSDELVNRQHMEAYFASVVVSGEPYENLRSELSSEEPGEGASLVSMEGGPTVEVAVNNRVIRTTSVSEIKGYDVPAGYVFSLNSGTKSGIFDVTDADLSAEIAADPQEGVYIPMGNGNTAVRRYAEYELNLYWFDAADDYDANVETPGKIATQATDNFSAFNGARLLLEFRNFGRLVVQGGAGTSVFWAGNMPRFRLSNFEMFVAKGTTIRMDTPSSFGSTLICGEAGVTENVSVIGGGTIRNYLPNLDNLNLWQAETSYPAETYIKTTAGHAYWTEEGGTSGTTEPTVIAGSEVDGTVTWRDALNENAISMAGDKTLVEGMDVPSANNKGITIQTPPWRDAVFRDNIVGSTHHDALEMKGNQGIVGQELLIGARGLMENNTVLSAGRHGIHVEQPSSGTNKNQDIEVINNSVVAAGVRHVDGGHGIRINRCLRPVLKGNTVLSAEDNGVFLRQCEDVRGDVLVRNYGIWGLYLDSNDSVSLDSIRVLGNGGGVEAIRANNNTGTLWCGMLEVEGTNYTVAYEGLSGSVMRCGDAQLTAGASGVVSGDAPLVASYSIAGNFSALTSVNSSASVPATDRVTFLNETGKRTSVLSGAIYGDAGIRLEIIVDGSSVITISGTASLDEAGNDFTVIPIPPINAFDSLELRANNNTGSAQTIAWQVVHS